MPTVHILNAQRVAAHVVDVPDDTQLMDICDAVASEEIAFSCRSGTCGTCSVHVLEGHEHLMSAVAALRTRAASNVGHAVLACCTMVKAGPGTVRIMSATLGASPTARAADGSTGATCHKRTIR